MLTAGVIDDEPRSLRDLVRRLEETGICSVVCQSTDALQGLALLQSARPDFVLLDIEMPGLDGLALAAALPPSTGVIFVSAHSTHALSAFDMAAIDFLLKPVDSARFDRMMSRVQARFAPQVAGEPAQAGLLALETRRGRFLYPEAEILGIFAEGDMSRVLLRGDRQLYCLRPLKHFEQVLRSGRLIRLDRSTFLNLDAVRAVRPMPNAKAEITLADLAQPLVIGRAANSRLAQALAERKIY